MTPAEKLAVKTAQAFIEQHESDAHWARGPQQRAEHLEQAETLRTLIEAAERGQRAYSEGYADGYASAQRGDPPYVEPTTVEELPEVEYAIVTYYSAEGIPTFYPMKDREQAETWVRPWKDRTPWDQYPVERRVGGWTRIPRKDELNQVELQGDDDA